MEEKLKISDYLILCCEFEEDPSNEQKQQKIVEFLSKIVVKEYIPLKEKNIIMIHILSSLKKDYDAAGVSAMLEMFKIEHALLSYGVNIENDFGVFASLYHAYDMIMQYGLYDILYKSCGKDYKYLCNMIDSALNISNIYRLLETAELFNEENYNEWLASMREMQDVLKIEDIKSLIALTQSYTPEEEEMLKIMRQEALERVNSEMRDERQKISNALQDISKEDIHNEG